LDNRKSNLRLATRSQNNCNRKQKKGTSKYRGVCYNKRTKKWRAAISFNGMYKHLGFFDSEEEAGRAYDEAAKIYHGEFASLNFPAEKQILNPNI
ncbi:MAG: AP2 domain-containing protein, partial [Sedimentisphaerales bacterium]